ncbi:uncharacterized protein [Periplaneta americana]|uniref:uncharacterized protein n=1 Tax=Periplaneta americana TaxID=6978 RepID=UPI0037E77BDD
MMSTSSEDETQRPSTSNSVKKNQVQGRMTAVMKKLRVQSHEIGEDCNCKLKCFEKVSAEERSSIIRQFNDLEDWNQQSLHLTGLITIIPVYRRRSRKNEDEAQFRECNFNYRVRVKREDIVHEISICRKAFMAVHGITRRRLMTLQKCMKSGVSPRDGRGQHGNRPWKIKEEVGKAIYDHINSFKGRSSDYSNEKTKKLYLPEELSVKKMYEMFKKKYQNLVISYETYRTVFNTKFNIAFGYPRSDTCSACDKYTAEMKVLNARLSENNLDGDMKKQVLEEINKITYNNKIHKLKAETFYTRKRNARLRSRKSEETEAICMAYQKKLCLPNISTNDVYYRRQLSVYSFNIHQLSDETSVFYTYTEDIGRKGANEVVSFLNHFVTEIMDKKVRHLEIFCDSCSGQNKNYTVLRYLNYLVNELKLLDTVEVTFPIRGHSYMECDKNMRLINTKAVAEVPMDWVRIVVQARCKPKPFDVVLVNQDMIGSWESFLQQKYWRKCPFLTRPIREAIITKEHPRLIQHRDTYNGAWISSVLRASLRIREQQSEEYPCPAYRGPLVISKEKYQDLQILKEFCGHEARVFYTNLPH